MRYRVIQQKVLPLILFVLSSNTNATIDLAVLGKVYNGKSEVYNLFLSTKERVNTFATYKWKICNKDKFETEIKYYYFENLEPRVMHQFEYAMKIIASQTKDEKSFFTKSTTDKINNIAGAQLGIKGICVENLKMHPYKKTLESGTPKSGAL